jgi:RHS repeat-associated protein
MIVMRERSIKLAACFSRSGFCALLSLLVVGSVLGQTPMKLERTLPKFEPPTAGLAFSQNPTTQEIFHFRAFAEPLVPVGGEPGVAENSALASALTSYAKREGLDDFSSLTGFLETHPQSPWRAALLTDLGLEYYNTAYYSRALAAWSEAWSLAKNVTEANGKAIGDRALGELVAMHARVGHMSELEGLLQSVEGRPFTGPATERVANARGGLADMKERPEISFRCGPLALLRIVLASEPAKASEATSIIHASASTQRGFSLRQVAELSRELGLNYQMARRQKGATFIVPSVVHWKVGHYAALIRQEGDCYLLQDPTFRSDVWATKTALEEETSGYFVVPPGKLPGGWSPIESAEGDTIWGKGNVGGPDNGAGGGSTPPPCQGMAVSSADPLFISLTLVDNPVGYSPPVGPAARFMVHYNQRDVGQPAIFSYSNFGPKWTPDWLAFITDNPMNTNADVQYYRVGGFIRNFTGFNPNTQTFSIQIYDRSLLRRTSPTSYEMLLGDGTKMVFSQSDGSSGTSRRVFLTQIIDPFGNAMTMTYDALLRLVAVTDGIGQVTTLFYSNPTDNYKITKVIDPFGRFATFDYDASGHLAKITDVIGLTSQFIYDPGSDFINAMVTPYGTTSFAKGESGTTRSLETTYPDGTRDRVEFNQSTTNGIPASVPANQVPGGMATANEYICFRNTYYWSRTAYAKTYPDYTKARIYHWLHTPDLTSASGILESTKEPLENRVWYDYAGQSAPYAVGANSRPSHIGRVLDDGTTQLYTYAYDGFGHVTNSIDPVGRTLSFIYDTNNIDLLEVLQTRAGSHELLSRSIYNPQHLQLSRTGAAGTSTTYTYNARGQMLTETDPKNKTFACTYDTNGYLLVADGPLPGTNDVVTATYDAYGRIRTRTDMNGYTLTFDYDNLDRLTRITHPDATFSQYTYDRLDCISFQDRAGRQTSFEYDNMRQLAKKTDPLGRVTLFEWCRCGDIKSLTDPMGRTTSWLTDEQGRRSAKQYGDGSQVRYVYENTTSRLRQAIDERQQAIVYSYNPDNTIKSVVYANAAVPTPGVSYTYDPNYERATSMTDGTGTTTYGYVPITATPSLGAGELASVDGPLPNDTITYAYDEFSWRTQTAINGIAATQTFDALGRYTGGSNALGSFTYGYDGSSIRVVSQSFPNGQTSAMSYGGAAQDFALQQIAHAVGAVPVSQFMYGRDIPRGQITTWSQQAGAQPPSISSLGYDDADQLLSVTVTNAGALVGTFAYGYDPSGNGLTRQVGASNYTASYNALNQVNTTTAPGASRTNEWDAMHRLIAVNAGIQRTEFTYDGRSRMVGIRQLLNGAEVSHRLFVWNGGDICEERDATGSGVTKRYFSQGVKIETGPTAGTYYYTRDHLGSIRELTDGSGNVRARYTYDPFGRRTKVGGDVDADFGFAGMFWAAEANLSITRYRAYDPELGRWLSRDPLKDAEAKEGPNLYAYAGNEPINNIDPEGLCTDTLQCTCLRQPQACAMAGIAASGGAGDTIRTTVQTLPGTGFPQVVVQAVQNVVQTCVSFPPPPAVQAGLDKFASLARLPDAEDVIETEGGWVVEAIPNRLWSTVEQLEPVGNWWLRTMQATSNYADSIQKLSGLEARVAFGRELQSFAEKLFGR